MNVGEKVKELRDRRGWNQSQLADKSGVPQTTISNIEKLGTDPTAKTLKKLATTFDVSADVLLNLEVAK